MIFALCSETNLVSQSELYRLSQALERQAAQVCSAYFIDTPVAVVVIDSERKLPEGAYPIVCVDDGGDAGTLGSHWFAKGRDIPAARVYVEATSGLNAGPYSVSEVASHEVIEALINPTVGVWMQHVGKPDGIQSAYEIADPTQDDYEITANRTPWKVSNFCCPQYWMSAYANEEKVRQLIQTENHGVDWCGRMSFAGQILDTGYAVFREMRKGKVVRTWNENRNGPIAADSAMLARKQHPASRTQRLHGARP